MTSKKKGGTKFAVFILTHKRPTNQITIKSLRESGYTGKIYLVCDKDDPALKKYKKLYGDDVLVFDKKKYLGKFDLMTNVVRYDAVVYARNAVYDLAKSIGLKYVCVMDDDYSVFYTNIDKTGFYQRKRITDMNRVMRVHLEFLHSTGIATVAFSQGGDFVGGWNSNIAKTGFRPRRKAMNVFFFNVDRPVQFNGIINEDSTMGVQEAIKGNVILTNCLVQLEQTTTQQAEGGLTDIYKASGTYQKSFYTLMASPSSTKVMYQPAVGRIHHHITGNLAYPKIVSPDLKKKK